MIKTAISHNNLGKHLLFKIVSYRHNFTSLVVRRLYYNIYACIYNFSIHAFFFISTSKLNSSFSGAKLLTHFFQIFDLPYPSNICLKCYLELVPSLSTIYSFLVTIIQKIPLKINPNLSLVVLIALVLIKKKRVVGNLVLIREVRSVFPTTLLP